MPEPLDADLAATLSPAELKARWAALQAHARELFGGHCQGVNLAINLHDATEEVLAAFEAAGARVDVHSSMRGGRYRLAMLSDSGGAGYLAASRDLPADQPAALLG